MKTLLCIIFSISLQASIITSNDRIMVFSPHPDDEVLGAGALIKRAIKIGAEVQVVVMTCGDGYWNALKEMIASGEAIDHDNDGDFDYLDLGISRCKESQLALNELGVEGRIYMGLPDGALWKIYSNVATVKSHYTKAVRVPYLFAEDLDYQKSAVESSLRLLIDNFVPTVVVTPTATDSHGDHIATRAFVKELISSDVTHLEYLIHWEGKDKGYPHASSAWKKPLGHVLYD